MGKSSRKSEKSTTVGSGSGTVASGTPANPMEGMLDSSISDYKAHSMPVNVGFGMVWGEQFVTTFGHDIKLR